MPKNFKNKQLTDEAIPTVSLIDISFLLIIFFILTTTFQKGTGFVTDIPGGEKGMVQQQQKTPTIGLRANKIIFNDESVTMQELRKKLADLRLDQQTGDGKVVLLEASENIPYQDYFETMAMVSAAGGAIAIVREKGSR